MSNIVNFEVINKEIVKSVKAFEKDVESMPENYSLGLDTKAMMVREYASLLIAYTFEKLRIGLTKDD